MHSGNKSLEGTPNPSEAARAVSSPAAEADNPELTCKALAERLGVSPATVWTWAAKGTRVGGTSVRLRHIRRGNRIFLPWDAMAEFEAACTRAGIREPIQSSEPPTETEVRQELAEIETQAEREGL